MLRVCKIFEDEEKIEAAKKIGKSVKETIEKINKTKKSSDLPELKSKIDSRVPSTSRSIRG